MESCSGNDSVFVQIDRLLQEVQIDRLISTDSLSSSIFKVPNHLRQVNQAAYEPQAISIGPYHHGKDHLKTMEVYKLHYLKTLLNRTNETSVNTLETALKDLKDMQADARRFYSEPLNHIGDDKFVLMMLLDGCFVVELIRKSAMVELRGNDDPLLAPHYILRTVLRDLLLVENQLPFFILCDLFLLTMTPNDPEKSFLDMAIDLFLSNDMIPGSHGFQDAKMIKKGDCDVLPEYHLLSLLYDRCVNFEKGDCDGPSTQEKFTSSSSSEERISSLDPEPPAEKFEEILMSSFAVKLQSSGAVKQSSPAVKLPSPGFIPQTRISKLSEDIPPATELNEAGIKFQKIEGSSSEERISSLEIDSFHRGQVKQSSSPAERVMMLSRAVEQSSRAVKLQSLEAVTQSSPAVKLPSPGFIPQTRISKKVRLSKDVKEKLSEHIPPATELNEAGIKFEKIEGKSLFDITFRSGVILMPTLEIRDETESILRNLVAYEQCCIDVPQKSKRFTEYITVMDCLINKEKDVELLCGSHVIENCLGDNQVVAEMFNRIRDYVLLPSESFCYDKMFKEVNEYCNRDWNRWIAKLRHNYFNTPWTLISFIAAVFLLLLTVMQSVYTALSYHFA